ncbi:uncharacterized protein LOC108826071 isoform X2 [Raphanus sativus]|uniref:Uncharacterized protein LOC108826071 isoform X2 n=1 Tax=Raphanus sativus TaxID=3726 RepID=A0A6J0L446_RAPSA|nr:uncharacterized protein LOC108826071 isoform X2 [Raphanus sativus]
MGRDCGHGGGAIFSTKSKRKSNGCMAAFYHLFDFQHLYFPSHRDLTIDSPSRSKGLKLTEESPPPTTYKDKQILNIPVSMLVRTETGTRSLRLKAIATDNSTSSSEMCSSPGSKTPSLVARLMGLDLLPEKTDLNKSLSSLHTMTHHGTSRLTNHILSKKGTRLGGTRSLPESPRVSSARRSDFDIHRLSLQLNKENKREEYSCSRLKQQDQEEIQSPRQILKQIKERVVTRRVVGMDIANSVKNREAKPLRESNELRRDTTISCSPRTRFSNKENKPSSFRPEQTTPKPKPRPKTTKVVLVSVSKASGEEQSKNRVKHTELRPVNQCKKTKSETRFTQRPLKPSQTPDTRNKGFFSESTTDAKATNPLHKKKFKKIPKSSDVDNNIFVTKLPQKQVNEREGLKANETEETDTEAAARNYHGSELCSFVASYSSKRCCSNLGEIDRLLETKKLEEEEGEDIVAEIERGIVEALVQETVSELNIQRRRSETTSEKRLSR